MCRIEERVYIGSDGRRQIFEDKFPCDKSHRGKLCSKVKRRTTEYFPKQPTPVISRDDASSPLSSNNPPTPPAGTGGYLVEERRPSMTGTRPPRDPKIVIEFGGSKKDGKSKKYNLVTVNKSYKRSSLGAASVASNEGAVESPGSEASYTVRTGFADVPVPPTDPLGQVQQGFRPRHEVPKSHHRHVSSSSSHTTASSQPPSLYATSEPESPANSSQQLPVYPRTIVHNTLPGAAPPSPNASRAAASAPSYRTKTVTPQQLSRENVGADGLTPLDYSDFIDHSASSHASSSRAAAPEITDRAADRERRRKYKDDEKKRQEESDRRFAEELEKEEVKQVRFELGRAEEREKHRNESKHAESEKRRAEEREDARRRKKEAEARPAVKKESEARPPTKRPEREKTKPPTSERNRRHIRRASMTQADIDERNRLRLQEEEQMAREREATDQREREERAAALRQSQQTNDYWDPRATDRYPVHNNSTGVGRRGSVSTSRRPSISGNPPPGNGLGRANSQRVSIIQPTPPANLPPLNTQFAQPQQTSQTYSARPPSSHFQNPPPLFSPGSHTLSSRPPSARHHSHHDNPFAQPPTRTSHSSQDSNPFTLPSTRPVHPSMPAPVPVLENPFATPVPVLHSPPADPWDNRDMRDALPRQTLQRRGEEVLSRADGGARRTTQNAPPPHARAQQATRNLGTAQGYTQAEYESSDEEEGMKLKGKGARMGFGKSRRY